MIVAEYVRCRECGKRTRGVVPKGGDGSQTNPAPHKDHRTGEWCGGRYYEGLPDAS